MKFDGTQINLLVAFLGGIVTFFASCLLPLVPTYVAYLFGVSSSKHNDKREIFINSVLFTLGFILIFILLGLSASSVGLLLKQHRQLIQQIGGVFLMFVGLFLFGLFNFEFLHRERKIYLHGEIIKRKKLKSFFTGLTFGFAWTPCIGPVLGVILFWASQAGSVFKGTTLLLFYGLGLGLPFILIGLLFEHLGDRLLAAKKIGKVLNIIAATIMLVTGFLLVIGKLQYLSLFIMKLFNIDAFGI